MIYNFDRAIVLAGGFGTRLSPLTKIISKHLLPIYDRPMIHYPIKLIMKLGIKKINLISDSRNIKVFKNYFSSNKEYDLNISYQVQKKPNGIAESIKISEKFINNKNVILILGDNIFLGGDIEQKLISAAKENISSVFVKKVENPNSYGVFSKEKNKIFEKPKKKISDKVITGIYFFTKECVNYSKQLKFSKRGELEITDLNNIFLKKKKMKVRYLNSKTKWFDAGTFDNLLRVNNEVCKIRLNENKKKPI